MAEKNTESDDKAMTDGMNKEVAEGDTDDALAGSSGSESGVLHKKPRLQPPSPRPAPQPFMVPASPPKFVTFDDLMAAAAGVKNMSLAHEIAVDSTFKLEKLSSPNSIEKQVTSIVQKAFWDAFEERMKEDPPDYSQAIILLQEVKEKLESILLPQHKRLKTQISEMFELDMMRQKLDNEAFDIYVYSEYVIDIMGKLCSPARDDCIAKLKGIRDIIPLFKEILEVLDLMKMDMANFTIQQIRPYIQQQSVEYEKKKFEEFLKTQQGTGIDGLELTKLWLSRSVDTLMPPGDTAQPGGTTQASMATPAAILNGAYMEILQWDMSRLFPETLVLDQSRLLDLSEKTQTLTMITSILLVTYNTVGQSIAGVQALKLKLKDEISTLLAGTEQKDLLEAMENIGEHVNRTVEDFNREHGFKPRTELEQKTLKSQIKDLSSKDSPILSLMSKRLITFIQQALFMKHKEPLKVPAGMSVVEKELSQMCGQFLRLISHNRSVFGQYYTDIIGALLNREQQDVSPRPDS